MQDLHGRAVVLNFWTTWSGYSAPELGLLLAFARAHPEMYVVALNSSEDAQLVRGFVAEHQLEGLTVWLDKRGQAYAGYKLAGVPATFFIDMHGVLRSSNYGALPGIEALNEQARLAMRGVNGAGTSGVL